MKMKAFWKGKVTFSEWNLDCAEEVSSPLVCFEELRKVPNANWEQSVTQRNPTDDPQRYHWWDTRPENSPFSTLWILHPSHVRILSQISCLEEHQLRRIINWLVNSSHVGPRKRRHSGTLFRKKIRNATPPPPQLFVSLIIFSHKKKNFPGEPLILDGKRSLVLILPVNCFPLILNP